MKTTVIKISIVAATLFALQACGPRGVPGNPDAEVLKGEFGADRAISQKGTSIWDIFRSRNTEQIVKVNKFIWAASLDVLSFLPIETIDPFTGVIVTGYGTPPGGGRAYRATVYISDPALEARSLNVALQSRGGAVSAATARAIEDAILARARQLRGEASKY